MIIDLSAYMKAGYTPIMGCRKDVALAYVQRHYGGDAAELRNERIIVDGIPTEYYWEYDNLFKKGGQ